MSAPPPEKSDSKFAGSEVDAVLAEFGGDAHAAIAALLHDMRVLLADAEQATSRGFLRGKFSEGARRLVVDDEP
jgi:predicted HD phosphohydrolase